MKKTIFNLEAIVSIEIVDKKQDRHYKYHPYKNTFWEKTEEGFYGSFLPFISIKEARSGNMPFDFLFVSDMYNGNKLFYKPYVQLNFCDGSGKCQTFNTYDEALNYGNEMAKNIKLKLEFEIPIKL